MSTSPKVADTSSSSDPATLASQGPVFLVGVWRSGTSLLYTLVNQHPQIALLYEGDLPMLRPLFSVRRDKSEWLARWDFWNESLKRHRIDCDRLASSAADVRSATEEAYREFARARGAVIWGEKSPNWFDNLTGVSRDFPGARFIVIWRSPAQICSSIARAVKQDPWFDKKGMMLRCILGCEALKRETDRLIAAGIPVHQLRYEDLVGRPEATMRGICEFLGIAFDPRMATLDGADRSTIDQAPQHELVMGNQIVAKAESKPSLKPALKQKIARYRRLWQQKYGGNWMLLEHWKVEPGDTPEAWEQFKDRLLFKGLRKFDSIVVMIYSFAPLWLLKTYRASKPSSEVAAA